MRDILDLIRRLALGAVVLAALAVPLGAFLLATRSSGGGGNALGDLIAYGLGIGLVVIGGAALVLGSALAILAKRSIDDPAELRGACRTALAVALAVAGAQVLISVALGAMFSSFVGLSAAFAAGYLVVAAATDRRGDRALAGVLGVALLGVGLVPLWGQVSLNADAGRSAERAALLPADMDVAIDAAAAVAPDGWAVAVLVAKGTNLGIPSTSRDLPDTLIGQPLRGLLIVDCAGSADLDVMTMDDLGAQLGVGSVPCRPEPQVMSFAIPGVVDHAIPPAHVGTVSVDPVPNDGSIDVINRALILVALAETPDPDRNALLATFAAAYGEERPR
jgi:hypothetical protein